MSAVRHSDNLICQNFVTIVEFIRKIVQLFTKMIKDLKLKL
jgi:hypothetical protein